MFRDHLDTFSDYLIEKSSLCDTYLVPGIILDKVLGWYGKERLKAFKAISKFSPSLTDLDCRDEYYEHMILWDPIKLKLIGGQRFKFNINNYDGKNSYLENYHSGLYIHLKKKNLPFAEIGRTFIMPDYQNKKDLYNLLETKIIDTSSKHIDLINEMIKNFDKHNYDEALDQLTSNYDLFTNSIRKIKESQN